MFARISGWSVLFAALATWPGSELARAAAPAKKMPSWARVDEAVVGYFEALPEYRPERLIVRSEVQAVLERLNRMGWEVAQSKELLGLVTGDGDFLATVLRTPDGRKLMDRIAGYPDGYDRLDRLSRLPRGQRMVRDLIRGPDGYKLIEYMTESSGGKFLGKQLSRAPKGAHFNKPTGRIYTVKMLRDYLQKSYAEATQRAGNSY